MEPQIVFEDKHLLVLNKPSGWVVNQVKSTKAPIIQTWLKNNFSYSTASSVSLRSGVVHRLDKETSGILLVAKTKESFDNLQLQFKQRLVKKTYLALVHGRVEPEEGVIKTPVGRLPWNKERFGVLPGGRDAVTKYKVLSVFIKPKTENQKTLSDYSLLELYPKTGRTHQIRIHLKYLKYPIVSDEFYAGRKVSRKDRLWCPRLFLHASGISFIHPVNKKKLNFNLDLAKDLSLVLKRLRRSV